MNSLGLVLVLVAAIFTIAALVMMVAPFLGSDSAQGRFELLADELRELEDLVARKATIVNSLRELELDRESGRTSQPDYEETKRRLELEALRIMKRLDTLRGGRGWEEIIDAELARRLAARQGEPAPAIEADDEVVDDTEMIVCPSCGKELEADARFCSRCGHDLTSPPDDIDTTTTAAAVT